jgi:putative copper export protein
MAQAPSRQEATGLRPWLIILNDFCHDLFTGLWFGSFVTLAVLRQKAGRPGLDAGAQALMAELTGLFTWLTVAMLGCIVATGLFRFFYYRDWDGVHNKQVKKRLLIIKHAVLGTSFLAGTILVAVWGFSS